MSALRFMIFKHKIMIDFLLTQTHTDWLKSQRQVSTHLYLIKYQSLKKASTYFKVSGSKTKLRLSSSVWPQRHLLGKGMNCSFIVYTFCEKADCVAFSWSPSELD